MMKTAQTRNIGKDIKRVFIVLFIGVFLFTQNAFALHYTEDKSIEKFFKSDVSDAFQTAAIVALTNAVGGAIGGQICAIIAGVGQIGSQVAIAAGADPHTTMIVTGVLVGAACGIAVSGSTFAVASGAVIGGTVAEAGYEMQEAGWNPWLSAAATMALGVALSYGARHVEAKFFASPATTTASSTSTAPEPSSTPEGRPEPKSPATPEPPPAAPPAAPATPEPPPAAPPAAPATPEPPPAAPPTAPASPTVAPETAAPAVVPTSTETIIATDAQSPPMAGAGGTATEAALAAASPEGSSPSSFRFLAEMTGDAGITKSSFSFKEAFLADWKSFGESMRVKGIDGKYAGQYDSFWGGLGKVMLKQLSPGSVLNYALKGLAYELTKDKSENEKLLGAALASAASGIGGYYLNEAIGTSWAGNLKNNKGEIYNPYHRDESNVFKNVWARNILDAAAGAALDKIILETGQPQLTTLAKSALAWGASSVLLEAKTALGTYLAYDPTHDPKYLKDFLPPTYSFGQATTDSFIKSLALWYPLPQNVNGGGVGVYVKRQMKFWGLDNIKLLEAAKRNGGQVLYNNYILPEFSDFLRDEAAGNFVSSLLGPDGKESRAMKYWGDVPSTGSRVEAIKGIGISGK